MSKIGRKPIDNSGVNIELKGQEVHFKGPKNTGVYLLPDELTLEQNENIINVVPKEFAKKKRDINRIWGLHRALLSNHIVGAVKGFEKLVQIVGLGYKAILTGNKLVFSLGYSHKIDFELPKDVSVEVDKSGQKLVIKSFDKELTGHVASKIRALRPPEPYKGTGIRVGSEEIIRKAGKTKAA